VGRFTHVSLLIDLDFEWWLPTPTAFTDTENYVFPKRARFLIHESIHYWQQLSHGYMLALAQEDWRQLLEWEAGGRPDIGPMRAHYRQPEGRHGFSAYDLCECIARFWEILFLDPAAVLREAVFTARRNTITSEVPEALLRIADQQRANSNAVPSDAVRVAMDLSGGYAVPFAVVSEIVGENRALVIFPFLAHFALKTMRPAYFFEIFLAKVAPVLTDVLMEADQRQWDQGLFMQLYQIATDRCETVLNQADYGGLLHSPAIFSSSGLDDNPAYVWSFRCIESLVTAMGPSGTGQSPPAIDMMICLPAFEQFRSFLATSLAVPCVRFRDRQTLGICELFASHWMNASDEEVASAHSGMASVLSVQQRWESFQYSLRHY
jgi:hypothetical protein